MSLLTGQLSLNLTTLENKDNIILAKEKDSENYYVYSKDENYCFYKGNNFEKAVENYKDLLNIK